MFGSVVVVIEADVNTFFWKDRAMFAGFLHLTDLVRSRLVQQPVGTVVWVRERPSNDLCRPLPYERRGCWSERKFPAFVSARGDKTGR